MTNDDESRKIGLDDLAPGFKTWVIIGIVGGWISLIAFLIGFIEGLFISIP